VILDNASAHALDGLGRHSTPGDAAAYDEISRGNFNGGMRDIGGEIAVQSARCMAIGSLTMVAVNRL